MRISCCYFVHEKKKVTTQHSDQGIIRLLSDFLSALPFRYKRTTQVPLQTVISPIS